MPVYENAATPEPMSEVDIRQAILEFAAAARNAVQRAGFDAVEIHGANGYLPDQFLQDTCNRRTDRWGGSVENRARFHLEITRAVVQAVGSERTAMRLSPFSDFQGMLMADPRPTFEYLVQELRELGLVYLHLVEGRIGGVDEEQKRDAESSNFLVRVWDNRSPVLLAGGFNAESARAAVEGTYKDYDVGIVFGRYFVSNPDLVYRVKKGIPFAKYDRSTFYTPVQAEGYIDYPFSQEFLAEGQVAPKALAGAVGNASRIVAQA